MKTQTRQQRGLTGKRGSPMMILDVSPNTTTQFLGVPSSRDRWAAISPCPLVGSASPSPLQLKTRYRRFGVLSVATEGSVSPFLETNRSSRACLLGAGFGNEQSL